MLDIFGEHPFITSAFIGLSSHFITTAFFRLGALMTGSVKSEVRYWKVFLINFVFAFAAGIALTIVLMPLIAVPFCGIIVWAALIPLAVIPVWGFVLSKLLPIPWLRATLLIGASFIGSMALCLGMTTALILIILGGQ